MKVLQIFGIVIVIISVSCSQPQVSSIGSDIPSIMADSSRVGELTLSAGRGALLLSRFKSFAELKSIVRIDYEEATPFSLSTLPSKSKVVLSHQGRIEGVTSELKTGISETDFMLARSGGFWDKVKVGLRSPFAAVHKDDLLAIERLGRRRPWVYGKGDVAFYDLAETMVHHIAEQDILASEDLSEKGYLNTFNHITAQAFMTSIFSERVADFIADVHERRRMPELITGVFTPDQIADLENGPLDNYIDLINNEWGQDIGKVLRQKYAINCFTYWTPELMTNYLNDIQRYYCSAFQIGLVPFRDSDEIVIRFAGKINGILGNKAEQENYW